MTEDEIVALEREAEKWENEYLELRDAVSEFCNGSAWEAVQHDPDFIAMRDLL